MRKKIEWMWETVDEETSRAKVIGGWIVLHVKTTKAVSKSGSNVQQSESMIFVADRDHEWHLIEPISNVINKKIKIHPQSKKMSLLILR